jgi:hypothetical protein
MGPRIAALVILALACGTAAASRHLASTVHGDGHARVHEPRYQLPTGVKVRALVFYGRPFVETPPGALSTGGAGAHSRRPGCAGRRATVKLLNCYLERNLAKNGGLLHEVGRVQGGTCAAGACSRTCSPCAQG